MNFSPNRATRKFTAKLSEAESTTLVQWIITLCNTSLGMEGDEVSCFRRGWCKFRSVGPTWRWEAPGILFFQDIPPPPSDFFFCSPRSQAFLTCASWHERFRRETITRGLSRKRRQVGTVHLPVITLPQLTKTSKAQSPTHMSLQTQLMKGLQT